MKLVRVEHRRCDEACGLTYLMAPDDITQEKLQADVEEAIKLFDADRKPPMEKPKYPADSIFGYGPDMTVAQAQEMYKANMKAFEEWRRYFLENGRPFLHYMRKLGYYELGQEPDTISAKADWGHRHGQKINMSLSINFELPSIDYGF